MEIKQSILAWAQNHHYPHCIRTGLSRALLILAMGTATLGLMSITTSVAKAAALSPYDLSSKTTTNYGAVESFRDLIEHNVFVDHSHQSDLQTPINDVLALPEVDLGEYLEQRSKFFRSAHAVLNFMRQPAIQQHLQPPTAKNLTTQLDLETLAGSPSVTLRKLNVDSPDNKPKKFQSPRIYDCLAAPGGAYDWCTDPTTSWW